MIISEPSIVLKTVPLRESDVIVHLLGRNRGRVSAHARSARKSKKRFMGGIDVFDCATFSLRSPRRNGSLYTVESLSDRQAWSGLRANLLAFSLASVCLEVTLLFAQEDDEEGSALFNPLFLTLSNISKHKEQGTLYTLAAHYLLLVYRVSGFNLLDAGFNLPIDVKLWLQQMAERSVPIIPDDTQTTLTGFSLLLRYAEETLGHGLKTSGHLSRITSNC